MYFFQLCRRKPERAKQLILGGVRHALGPDYDIGTHFTPRYNPWQQRLCLVPDGDLFKSIKDGRASVVTAPSTPSRRTAFFLATAANSKPI
jgi:cation diffusion facilitator CzcD-associated flavoprotein CzcO